MSVKTRKVITLDVAELPFEPELDAQPVEHIDPVVTKRDDGSYTVAYAVQDETYDSYDWSDGVEFYNADRNYESPSTLEEVESMEHVFYVERYEHGLVRYALVGESSAVDRQWDVSLPIGLIGLSDDFTDPEEAARAVLDEYTAWCNGDVYGIVRQDFESDGGLRDFDIVWGFIGSEYAENAVKNIDDHL